MAKDSSQHGIPFEKPPGNPSPPAPQSIATEMPQVPDFVTLLRNPLVKDSLPKDFVATDEAEYLAHLWTLVPALHTYTFQVFVHAGGSGMVFRVVQKNRAQQQALKLVRKKLFERATADSNVATTLSPVSEQELLALEVASHPHLVRLYGVLNLEGRILGLATTYVPDPQPLTQYIRRLLTEGAGAPSIDPESAFSSQRVTRSTIQLTRRISEVASALDYLHSLGIYHFDVKPANILVGSDGKAILTDMGACIHAASIHNPKEVKVHFTWTYAHPDLTTIIADPTGLSGGGLKATATIDTTTGLSQYDLFALGKTVQEELAWIEEELGARAAATYGFRCLHLIACLLLDGKNASGSGDVRRQGFWEKDGRRFASDFAFNYPYDFFVKHSIASASMLVERLARADIHYNWASEVPELSASIMETINTGTPVLAPYTERVKRLFMHPVVRRLRGEHHLGWIKEVYPNATHTRWTHTLGTFACAISYYNSLLTDPDIPTLRLVADAGSIEAGLVAAILHDVGQTAFGHDFESVNEGLFAHENLLGRLFDETLWGEQTLRKTLAEDWPRIQAPRLLAILKRSDVIDHKPPPPVAAIARLSQVMPIDALARDCISGPIDADKLDYLVRDGQACGVSYPQGIDLTRFLRSLTVDVLSDTLGTCKIRLAYRAKARAAVESVLLARYQMYGAVYWHHTYRCIQAMFVHAAASSFTIDKREWVTVSGKSIRAQSLVDFYYKRVILRLSWEAIVAKDWLDKDPNRNKSPDGFWLRPPATITQVPAFEFVWRFAKSGDRKLLELLGERLLFKRVCEIRLGALGRRVAYADLRAELEPANRIRLAKALQDSLMRAVKDAMRRRGPSVTESIADATEKGLESETVPLIVIDFPIRGVSSESNIPHEIGDPERKYFTVVSGERDQDDDVFYTVRELQTRMATLRVFAEPRLHNLVIRYLSEPTVLGCLEAVIPKLKTR